jgi:hypothetical protein
VRFFVIQKLSLLALLAFAATALSPLTAQADGQWVMIVHQSETGSQAASRRSLPDPRSVLMGRQVRWEDGSNIDLVLPSKASGDLDELSSVLGLRDASALQRHWLRLAFGGRADPPRFLGSTEEILQFVRATPGAAGVIWSESIDNLGVDTSPL